MTLLRLESLSLDFTRYAGLFRKTALRVLDDVSLSLERGEVLAVIGASGGGKSLLAQSILGLLPPNAVLSGEVAFEGTVLSSAGRARLAGRRIALMPQSIAHLDPLARAGRQIGWAAERAGRSRAEAGALVPEALARFGLAPGAARAFPHELSGGMARRVLLAMASVGEADLILADEPTSGLDHANARAVLGHLRALADAGRGVMLITHDLALALPHADRVAILREGRLVALEDASDFAGRGQALGSAYARALWRALPQNDFAAAPALALHA